jgi:hypothetical protein
MGISLRLKKKRKKAKANSCSAAGFLETWRREKRMEGIEGIMRGKTTMKEFSKHSCITTINTFSSHPKVLPVKLQR